MAENGKIEYQSAEPEIADVNAEISRATHVFVYLSSIFCLSFLVWASIFQLDIVSDAPGEVIPRSKVKRVQHLEGGIVQEILVREGDSVKQGQPLVILEETLSGSTVEELQVRVNALTVDKVRLEAEEKGADAINFTVESLETSPELVDQAIDLFETRRRTLENDLGKERETLRQREQDILEIKARLTRDRSNVPLVRKQLNRSKELYAEKLIKEDELIGRQKELNNLLSEINENTAALERAESMLASANSTYQQVLNNYQEDVQTKLKKTRRELLEVTQRLRKFSDIEQRTVIRSPVDGDVNSLYIVNIGEVIKPGMTIMDIVPGDDRLVVEAHLPIRDIGYVELGQKAVIKLASADARRFGNLDGEVVHISPDAVTLPTGETFYRVRVEMENDHFERGDDRYRLFPGMRVVAAIHTGKRSVIEYLAYPYFDSLGEGLRER